MNQQKIYITQGYEKGIGIEVFQKSYQCLSTEMKKRIIFVGNPNHLNIEVHNILPIKTNGTSETLSALNLALENVKRDDFVVTLPSSKDQFQGFLGHTEYLRHYYNNPNLGMSFVSPKSKILLLSDHIHLSKVSEYLNRKMTIDKINQCLEKYPEIEEIYIAGINPHAGESGLLGTEESIFLGIEKEFSKPCYGPFSADTLLFKQKSNHQLFVFAYHDQALTVFKKLYGLLGLNITTGLDFWRISVDHGTAPDIAGKNQANYQGMNYLFEFINEKIYRSS